jgi:hypothetical protein
MLEWLEGNGLKKSEILALYRAGKIRAHTLPPSKVKHFWAKEIKKEILDGIKGKSLKAPKLSDSE